MPCEDSSSNICIILDHDEKFVSFEYTKITCGKEVASNVGINRFFAGKTLEEIISIPFSELTQKLNATDEESQFILYLEWDALRIAIAQYLGVEEEGVDTDRCQLNSIHHNEEGIEINQVMLPPQDMPAILPCHIEKCK